MDLTAYLKTKNLWELPAPKKGTDRTAFDAGLTSNNIKEISSFAPDVYMANHLVNPDCKVASQRATGYFLTEHILSHPKWKGESRFQDLYTWGANDKSIKKLMIGDNPYHLSSGKPSQFEWLQWLATAVSLDAKDPNLSNEIKLGGTNLLHEEVKRISQLWSHRKSQAPNNGESVLTQAERRSKKVTVETLKFIFGALHIPSSEQFFPKYSPEKQAPSIQTGIQFDESYHKKSSELDDYDEEFDEDMDEEDMEERPVSQDRKNLAQLCLASFFLFEHGNAIINELRAAKVQTGLRTVEPMVPIQLPTAIAAEHNIPSAIAYVKSIDGVAIGNAKAQKSYIYARVGEDGQVLMGDGNEFILSKDVHTQIRNATSPWLKMPEGNRFGAPKARYIEASRKGYGSKQIITYTYKDENENKFSVDSSFHKQVKALNPEHESQNVRGRIDHLFTKFFVDEVKPHFRPYLPESQEESIILRDQVKESLSPYITEAWEDIAKKGGTLAERTAATSKKYSEWFQHFKLPGMDQIAGKLFSDMKETQKKQISEMVSRNANQKALVMYMEHIHNGENPAPGYKAYGERGKFKTWKTQIKEEGGKDGNKLLTERMSKAAEWVEKEHGGLSSLVPATHSSSAVLEHFNKEANSELRDKLDKMQLPQPKGLVGLTEFVNPLSVLIFYDRRMQMLEWNYALDKPLPNINLSTVAKSRSKYPKTHTSSIQSPVQEEPAIDEGICVN